MTKLNSLEGVGVAAANKLRSVGIESYDDLLAVARTPEKRKEMAQQTGISSKRLLCWTNRADLARIKGVGGEYADLLEAAGIQSVNELAAFDEANLHASMVRVNSRKKLVRRVPAVSRVASWVEQAKSLPSVVVY